MATLARRMLAEAVGTFGLIYAGCGVVVLGGCRPDNAADLLCIAVAFGLAAFAMTRAVGPVSGAHLNPAMSFGLAAARRFAWRDVLPYIVAQLTGAIAAGMLLLLTAQGQPEFSPWISGFAANGYGEHSPTGFDMPSALTVEFAATGMLVIVTASVTRVGRLTSAGSMVAGLSIMMAHLLALPVTHAALNPARATAMALFVQDWAMEQLWLFWAAPMVGGLIGGLIAYCVLDEEGTIIRHDGFIPLVPWPEEPEEPAPPAVPRRDPPPPYKGEPGSRRRRRGHGTAPIRP